MKDFKILVNLNCSKELFIKANSPKEALLMATKIIGTGDISFDNYSDFSFRNVPITEDYTPVNECENCPDKCDVCGSCLLLDNEFEESDECYNCPFYCNECSSCLIDYDDLFTP